jgi:hypothetical protein
MIGRAFLEASTYFTVSGSIPERGDAGLAETTGWRMSRPRSKADCASFFRESSSPEHDLGQVTVRIVRRQKLIASDVSVERIERCFMKIFAEQKCRQT